MTQGVQGCYAGKGSFRPMSETTPHHHPEYEETFARVATILDVMAQEQLALQQGQAALQQGQGALQQGQSALQQGQAALQRGQAELQRAHAETERTLREFIAHTEERDAETTD